MVRARWLRSVAFLALLGAAVVADAQSTQLHEFIPPDPAEDLELAATTTDGELPAALETQSGIVRAPDATQPPSDAGVYGSDGSDDPRFQPDRDTRQPEVERYDDPFTPVTAPFKRLRAFDTVGADYTLGVAERPTRILSVGGTASAGDDPFFGDLVVDVAPSIPVRIPSVGPGARALKLQTIPETKLTLLEDGAQNWFVRAEGRARVRLVMELAIPRATFGSELLDVGWEKLERFVPAFAPHTTQAARVFDAIGVSHGMRPKEAVAKMVAYFRAFEPSTEPPRGTGDVYLDLALSKKGVCRHRAFAFLVTALELGIPARMVVNEAHAWVEVFDSQLWHRIDLGGAALDLDGDGNADRPAHAPPNDPFPWPDSAEPASGQALAQREREQAATTEERANDPAPASSGSVAPATSAETTSPTSSEPSPTPAAKRPPVRVELELLERAVRRGERLRVRGSVTGERPCGALRVDLVFAPAEGGAERVVGSVSTDANGAFDGAIALPRDVPPGDHELYARTEGGERCGPGRSR
jgi:hypothetical protein